MSDDTQEPQEPQRPAQGPVTIKLAKPITVVDGIALDRPITQIVISPLKGKHLRTYDERRPAMQMQLDLAGLLTGQDRAVINELESYDLADVLAAVNLFFMALRRRPTGSSSSDE